MSLTMHQVITEALKLQRSEREQVAKTLFASLDRKPAVNQAWEEEVQRRIHGIESGATKLVSGDEVTAEIERLLR